jgi:protein-tyrosine phosphatase
MIDFHSHILPRLDDGSKSSDMSVQMLQASGDYGIDVMVATPHFYIKHDTVERFIKGRKASYDALMHKVKLSGVEIPTIRLGAEVYYFGNIHALPEIKELCIEGTNYLLLEMPFEAWTDKMISDVERLVYDCNIIPIIAHLDRYLAYQKRNNHIRSLLNMGAVVQMNGEYVNGLFTRKHALSLIKSGVVSLLGSDCHNMDNRKPNLDKTFKIVKSKCGQETLDKIDRCGREILGI